MNQPLAFRGEAIFTDLKVDAGDSVIHGKGAFCKDGAAQGDVLLDVVLPSMKVDKGFASKGGGYDCNRYVIHCDGLGAMLIDPADRMRGNFGACREDFKLGVLRLLNHSNEPNISIKTGEVAKPGWYEAVGEKFTLWYGCSLIATREIEAGEELTIKYAVAPEGAS